MLLFLATARPSSGDWAWWIAGRVRCSAGCRRDPENTYAFVIATPCMIVRVMARQPLAELSERRLLRGPCCRCPSAPFLGGFMLRGAGGGIGFWPLRVAVADAGRRQFRLSRHSAHARLSRLGRRTDCDGTGVRHGISGAPVHRLDRGRTRSGRSTSDRAEARARHAGQPLHAVDRGGRGDLAGRHRIAEPVDRFLSFVGVSAAPAGVFALGLALHGWMKAGGLLRVLPMALAKLILHPLAVWFVMAVVLQRSIRSG